MTNTKFAHEWLGKYPWLQNPEIFPFPLQEAGIVDVAKRERSMVFYRLDAPFVEYGLNRCVLVDKRGEKIDELEIKFPAGPGRKIGDIPVIVLYSCGKFVGLNAFRSKLDKSAYCLFFNPKDPAIMVLWKLRE